MREMIYTCDKCKKRFEPEQLTTIMWGVFVGKVSDNLISQDFCPTCWDKIKKFATTPEEVKVTESTPTVHTTTVVKTDVNSGPMSAQEVDLMVRLFNEGKTIEEIAARLKRSTRGINISLNKHKDELKSSEEITEIIRKRGKEDKAKTVPTSSINHTKKYDKSGMVGGLLKELRKNITVQ